MVQPYIVHGEHHRKVPFRLRNLFTSYEYFKDGAKISCLCIACLRWSWCSKIARMHFWCRIIGWPTHASRFRSYSLRNIVDARGTASHNVNRFLQCHTNRMARKTTLFTFWNGQKGQLFFEYPASIPKHISHNSPANSFICHFSTSYGDGRFYSQAVFVPPPPHCFVI